jgi:two-component system, NarL family, nitrate/nitrite response regulator NarL
MSTTIKVFIADDHTLFIDGLKLLLKDEHDVVVLDVANEGKELLHLLEKELPDIVLLDINMPGINGLETTRHVKRSYGIVKVIILSTYNDEHLIDKAKQYGANGYLLKNCNKEELLQTIRSVFAGHDCFPTNILKSAKDLNLSDSFLKQFQLSKRELEVIDYIKKGLTNQQIADALFLSIYTVETHRKNIMQKLKLNSAAALMKFILENKL